MKGAAKDPAPGRLGTGRPQRVTAWSWEGEAMLSQNPHAVYMRNYRKKTAGRVRIGDKRHYFRHGMTQTPTYGVWSGMVGRCTNPNFKQWKDYGGRGIKVCERWMDFRNFLLDMGEKPEGKLIDRWPNNDGNYEPGNCRWATRREQQSNMRSNVRIAWNGEILTCADWGRRLGIPQYYRRVRKIRRELGRLEHAKAAGEVIRYQ